MATANLGLLCLIFGVVAVTGLLMLWLIGCYLSQLSKARLYARQVRIILLIRILLLSLITVSGLIAVVVSEYYLFQDWYSLMKFHERAQQIIMSAADMRSLVIATSEENAFRINTFADGVGVLLGAILAGMGLTGLCLLRVEDLNSSSP